MTNWRSAFIGLVLVVCGVLLGSDVSQVAKAQTDQASLHPLPPFVVVGETITIRYRGFSGDDCRIEAIKGYFVKCQGKEDNWYNLMGVERILRGAGKK
jgi:hypothetical protein